jgi:hypothetical protein
MDFIPLADLGDDADAIVARIRSIADQDKAVLDSVTDNLAVQDEADQLPWHNKVVRSLRGQGSPH